MSSPFESAPIEHQQALHNMIFGGASQNSIVNPSEQGSSPHPMIPVSQSSAAINEKVKPHLAKSLVHSGVKSASSLGKL